jgi:hypothetical protein
VTASDRGRPRGERGLVLLEILIAMTIFTFVVLAWAQSSDHALAAASAANQDRTLRLLAARKLAEIRARPAEFAEGGDGGFEEEVEPGEDNPFLDYAWKVEATRVCAAGRAGGDETGYLFKFDEDAEEEPAPAAAAGAGGAGATPTKPVELLRLRLVVSHIPTGSEGEEFRLVTYVPAPKDEEGTR